MKKPSKQQFWLALSCLVSIIVAFCATYDLEGEFIGGWLTGPLFQWNDAGTMLFALAFVVTFLYPRIASAIIAFVSSTLCLPLYLYLVAPVPFAAIFAPGHPFKVQPTGSLHWDTWAIGGILILAITIYLCLRTFAVSGRTQ
jgi:hypothetical protein